MHRLTLAGRRFNWLGLVALVAGLSALAATGHARRLVYADTPQDGSCIVGDDGVLNCYAADGTWVATCWPNADGTYDCVPDTSWQDGSPMPGGSDQATGGSTNTTSPTALPSLLSLTLSPSTLTAGGTATATLTVSAAAPNPGGLQVIILTTDETAALPQVSYLTVPGGQSSATFTVTAQAVTQPRSVTIEALFNHHTVSATLTVQPPAVLPRPGLGGVQPNLPRKR